MKLYDEEGKLITFTKQEWVGGWFGTPAKQSLINSVLLKYFNETEATLLVDGYYHDTSAFKDIILENRSDHYSDPRHYRRDRITLGSSFNSADKTYFPFWLFFSKFAQQDDIYAFPEHRKYYVSCLNRNIRIQRILNLVDLSHRPYFKDIHLTFRKLYGHNVLLDLSLADGSYESSYNPDWDYFENNDSTESIFWKVKKLLGQDYLDEFVKLYQTAPDINLYSTNEYYHCSRVYESGWGNSYLNIVTEPQVDDIGFVSEKVFKPIRAEQLFLIQGCPGTVQYLESIGFDTFNDYIDHSYYDNESDWIIRNRKMLEVLDKIYNEIPNIFAATKQRRLYNRLHLASQELENTVLKDLFNNIKRKQNDM